MSRIPRIKVGSVFISKVQVQIKVSQLLKKVLTGPTPTLIFLCL